MDLSGTNPENQPNKDEKLLRSKQSGYAERQHDLSQASFPGEQESLRLYQAVKKLESAWPKCNQKETERVSEILLRSKNYITGKSEIISAFAQTLTVKNFQAAHQRAELFLSLQQYLDSPKSLILLMEKCLFLKPRKFNYLLRWFKHAQECQSEVKENLASSFQKACRILAIQSLKTDLRFRPGHPILERLRAYDNPQAMKACVKIAISEGKVDTSLKFHRWLKDWDQFSESDRNEAARICHVLAKSKKAKKYLEIFIDAEKNHHKELLFSVSKNLYRKKSGFACLIGSVDVMRHTGSLQKLCLESWNCLLKQSKIDIFSCSLPQVIRDFARVIDYLDYSRDPLQDSKRFLDVYIGFLDRSFPTAKNQPLKFGELLCAMVKDDFYENLFLNPQAFEKLLVVLAGRGLNKENTIHTEGDFRKFIKQLSANVDILSYINESDPHLKRQKLRYYVDKYDSDNPPFSILDRNAQPPEVQSQFQSEISSVMLGAQDSYFGAWANTFTFRRTPVKRNCLFDDMVIATGGKLYPLPVKDFNRFPGSGRIAMLKTDAFFAPDKEKPGDPYHRWKNETFKYFGRVKDSLIHTDNFHAIDNFEEAIFVPMRAGFAVSVPKSRFMRLNGENMTYIDWNHHFDATGVNMASLVPTRAFLAALNVSALKEFYPHDEEISLEEFQAGFQFDLSDNPPTLANIRKIANKIGCRVGIVNLTSGSNINGGLCNGLDYKSPPYRTWEKNVPDHWYDGFGLKHKYHVRDNREITDKMWEAHRRIYEISTALQRVRDIYRYALGRDCRGDTNRGTGTKIDSELNELSYYYQGKDPARLRVLQLFCEFVAGYRKLELPREMQPNLVLAPMVQWAAPVSGPFVLDGYTGVAYQDSSWSGPRYFEIDSQEISPDLLNWWADYVDPYLDQNRWVAPRLVARENCLSLMKQYGYKGT